MTPEWENVGSTWEGGRAVSNMSTFPLFIYMWKNPARDPCKQNNHSNVIKKKKHGDNEAKAKPKKNQRYLEKKNRVSEIRLKSADDLPPLFSLPIFISSAPLGKQMNTTAHP